MLFCHFLIFIINGFNEIFVIVQFFILSILAATGAYKKFSSFFLLITCICFFASALISFLAPGNFIRAELIPQSSFPGTVAAILFALLNVIILIFKNPLLWFVLAVLFIYGNLIQNNTLISLKKRQVYILIFSCAIILFPFFYNRRYTGS